MARFCNPSFSVKTNVCLRSCKECTEMWLRNFLVFDTRKHIDTQDQGCIQKETTSVLFFQLQNAHVKFRNWRLLIGTLKYYWIEIVWHVKARVPFLIFFFRSRSLTLILKLRNTTQSGNSRPVVVGVELSRLRSTVLRQSRTQSLLVSYCALGTRLAKWPTLARFVCKQETSSRGITFICATFFC